eukprot:6203714-Pleurochrysis_carterae.AAC.1
MMVCTCLLVSFRRAVGKTAPRHIDRASRPVIHSSPLSPRSPPAFHYAAAPPAAARAVDKPIADSQ